MPEAFSARFQRVFAGLGLIAALMAVTHQAGASEFVLVHAGKQTPIVLSSNASQVERFAATELGRYLNKMSGASPQVSTNSIQTAIRLRVDSGSDLGRDGYSIRIQNYQLLLKAGSGRGLLYAVYDLLERVGCRFLAPAFDHYQGRSEIIPRTSQITLSLNAPVIEKPKFKFRKLYVEEGLSHTTESLKQLIAWMPTARFNTLVVPINYQGAGRVKWDNWRDALTPELQRRGITIEVGGHGYQNFLNASMEGGTLFDAHPEWFCMKHGKRVADGNGVFCTSNPRAVRYLARNVVAYLRAHPEIQIFDFWPPDGAQWCECPECNKLGEPSDRQSRLVKEVMAAVAAAGITVRFEVIAYGLCLDPPATPPMDSQVLVDFCPINQCFEAQINDPNSAANAAYADAIQRWRNSFTEDVSIYSYYRKYAWRSLPNVIPHYMQTDIQWYASVGVDGVSSYAEPGDWQAYELNHYVLGRLAWNGKADLDSIIRQFARARYGKAATQAIALYSALEETVRKFCHIPGTTLKPASEIAAALVVLEKARQAFRRAAGMNPASKALLFSSEYAVKDLELQEDLAANVPEDKTRARIKSLAEFLHDHAKDGIFVNRSGNDEVEKLNSLYTSSPRS